MAAPAPAHGFALNLDSAENRFSVDGSYNAAEYPSARDALAPILAWISEKARSMDEPRLRRATLGGLHGTDVVVKYREKNLGARRVCRSVAAIRRIKPTDTMGIVYEIVLDTSSERVVKDAQTYEAIVQSFRMDPLKHY